LENGGFATVPSLDSGPHWADNVPISGAAASASGVGMREFEVISTELKLTHPICPACDVPMWLTYFEPEPTQPGDAKCTFECKACGSSVTKIVQRV
jgi:hypothetical protein